MRLGLCGAQRVGKTTLARAFSEQFNIPFVQTNTRLVFQRLGLDPKEQLPIERRITTQFHILEELNRQWEEAPNAIFDRTPFDVLAYMEADVLRDFPKDCEEAYLGYRKRCLDYAANFGAIVLVQPGIPIIEEEGAAQGSLPYMEHFNSLCKAYLTYYPKTTVTMPRDMLKLYERVAFLDLVYHSRQQALDNNSRA